MYLSIIDDFYFDLGDKRWTESKTDLNFYRDFILAVCELCQIQLNKNTDRNVTRSRPYIGWRIDSENNKIIPKETRFNNLIFDILDLLKQEHTTVGAIQSLAGRISSVAFDTKRTTIFTHFIADEVSKHAQNDIPATLIKHQTIALTTDFWSNIYELIPLLKKIRDGKDLNIPSQKKLYCFCDTGESGACGFYILNDHIGKTLKINNNEMHIFAENSTQKEIK